MKEMNYDYKDQETDQKEKEGMTVLVVEPLKAPYLKTISGELELLQNEVGGMIDATYPFEDRVAIVLNDEGKLNGLMPNRGLYDDNGNLYDIIAGTFLVTGLTEDDFCSLNEELAAKYMEKYRVPERMACVNGQVMMIPMSDGKESGNRTPANREPERRKTRSADRPGAASKNGKSNEKKSGKRNRADEER